MAETTTQPFGVVPVYENQSVPILGWFVYLAHLCTAVGVLFACAFMSQQRTVM